VSPSGKQQADGIGMQLLLMQQGWHLLHQVQHCSHSTCGIIHELLVAFDAAAAVAAATAAASSGAAAACRSKSDSVSTWPLFF